MATLVFAASSAPIFADEAWILTRQGRGVQVHAKKIPGSEIESFRGECEIDATLESILAVFEDVPKATGWFASCLEARTLSREGKARRRVYYRFRIPWPFWNRDAVYDVSARLSGDRAVIEAVAANAPEVPCPRRHLRITDSRQLWILERAGAKKTRAVYESRIMPEGSIPPSLANKAFSGFVFHTMDNLKTLLAKSRGAAD
ncbi:MAG: hypothetical protein HZB23_16265 [Deltaproteobacteria bacterium]|nr:hypothetical protein [Deltaproteobacteria bacterium]